MSSKLLRRSALAGDGPGVITTLSAADAGWELLNFQARRLAAEQVWQHHTGENELCMVVLGGRCSLQSDAGNWREIGGRDNVFDGLPYAVYLPPQTRFTVQALSERLEVAYAWTASDGKHPARLITPSDAAIEIRGGHNATRQITSVLPPGFDCHRLVCVEVYTPSGNWSSYPPHKHDRHTINASGELIEADLEEIYFYKFKQKGGWAFQRVYTDDRRLDEAIVAQDNDIVLVPEGYHPVSTAYGFDCYYLNFLAGSAQSLSATYDPAYDWTRETWSAKDPRLPLVSLKVEAKMLS